MTKLHFLNHDKIVVSQLSFIKSVDKMQSIVRSSIPAQLSNVLFNLTHDNSTKIDFLLVFSFYEYRFRLIIL